MTAMARLLVVHHTPSPSMQEMLDAVLTGARDDVIDGVEVVVRPALSATVIDVLEADGYLLGTPANIGYISGALKHFFDTIYYPCLEATKGRPFGAYLHGNLGTEGAERAIETITTGLGWKQAAPLVSVAGGPSREDRDALTELGGTVAATLMS
jgi:multimeric flavodoxin WrbA